MAIILLRIWPELPKLVDKSTEFGVNVGISFTVIHQVAPQGVFDRNFNGLSCRIGKHHLLPFSSYYSYQSVVLVTETAIG